jgi:protoheme IX farnesyltransferase
VKKGVDYTIRQILAYVVGFVLATELLYIKGYTGVSYALVMTALGIYWLGLGIQGLRVTDKDAWAHKMFHTSLIVLMLFCLMISITAWLP